MDAKEEVHDIEEAIKKTENIREEIIKAVNKKNWVEFHKLIDGLHEILIKIWPEAEDIKRKLEIYERFFGLEKNEVEQVRESLLGMETRLDKMKKYSDF